MTEKRTTQPLILLSAGGTGGHVFPARAVAEELLSQGYRVALATDKRGEKYLNGLDGVEIKIITSGGYQHGITGKVTALLALIKGYIQSHFLLTQLKPSVVVGFGGYPSAPPIFAAQHRFIPTILHEQNAILGLANALLAGRAKKLALSSSHTTGIKPSWAGKCTTTGNPVRQDIADLKEKPYPDSGDGKLYVMVVGGSQGAKSFATIIPHAITALPDRIKQRLYVFHQARPEDITHVKEAYGQSGIETDIRSFFDDMAHCIEKSHLLITRSGASTIAELTVAGRPAIYIPFPWNRDNQQFYNAAQVQKEGGAIVIEEKDLTIDGVKDALEPLLTNPVLLSDMARNAAHLGISDAAKRLSCVILNEIH